MPPFTLCAENHFTAAQTTLAVTTLLASLAALWLFAVARWLRAAADARSAEHAHRAPPRVGLVIIGGTIELDDDPVAVRVTITQRAKLLPGERPAHRWDEVDRRVEARPFVLRLATGERVRVVPGASEVRLITSLRQREWKSRAERRLRAELRRGQRAWVEGRLSSAPAAAAATASYRERGTELVLEPSRSVMRVFGESPETEQRLRARATRLTALAIPLLALVALTPMLAFWVRAAASSAVEAEFEQRLTFERFTKSGGRIDERAAQFRYRRDRSETLPIDEASFQSLPERAAMRARLDDVRERERWLEPLARPDEPRTLWVRYVRADSWFNAVGRENTAHIAGWSASAAATAALALWVASRLRARRWYDRSTSEPRHDGPIPEPTGERFEADE